MRRTSRAIFFTAMGFYVLSALFFPVALWSLIFFGPIFAIGVRDYFQRRHSVLRNFPILGHFRFFFEMIRPEINQYFVESNSDGKPFSREERSLVYQRAKKVLDTLPFGTQKDVNHVGYEWVNHSIMATSVKHNDLRITIGGPDCKQPYSCSVFNISAMSYGSLSKNAVLALNGGAKLGQFYHNTGEGSCSPYHIEPGGDIVYQLGTGYFGSRDENGNFSAENFKKTALLPQVKMIEIKLSQGAKPGHGGILPAKKLTPEIAKMRGVPLGQDVLSPPSHAAFKTPTELIQFIKQLRDLSGGKPVGFKLCVGRRREFLAICKAMLKENTYPDYIAVDGGEGGTGAAPVEFSNSVGCPLREGLILVHNALVGFNIRDKVKVIATGKMITGFDVLKTLSIGADVCNSARGMMLALGCIQALRCNTNHCPVGVATQDPELYQGLDVNDKAKRVANYHHETLHSVAELMGAMGVTKTSELRPWMIMRRTAENEIRHYADLYHYLKPGDLLKEELPQSWAGVMKSATPDSFKSIEELNHQEIEVFSSIAS